MEGHRAEMPLKTLPLKAQKAAADDPDPSLNIKSS